MPNFQDENLNKLPLEKKFESHYFPMYVQLTLFHN